MKKKILAALLAAAMTVKMLAGCGVPGDSSDDGGDKGGDKKSVTYGVAEDPPTVEPQLMNSLPRATAAHHPCNGTTR